MSDSMTLRQISNKMLAELFTARTDFLLRQTEFWNEMNAKAGEVTVWAKPDSLDLDSTRIEFYIRPRKFFFLLKFLPPWLFGKNKKTGFILSASGQPGAIKVVMNIRLQNNRQLTSELYTVPETGINPEETDVAGITG